MKKMLLCFILALFTINVQAQVTAGAKETDSLSAHYQQVFDDPNQKSFFKMMLSVQIAQGVSSSKVISSNSYNVLEFGVKVKPLLADLLHCYENQIQLPKNFKSNIISYCFKQDGLLNKEHGEKLLLKQLLENLKLKYNVSSEMQSVLILEVTDTAKLNQAKTIKKTETGVTEINQGGVNAITIDNGTLNTLTQELQRTLSLRVEIKSTKLAPHHYNFNLNNGSIEIMQQSLEKYGLSLKKEEKTLQKYIFESY
jgi:histidinol phosphatase-like enzyme